MLLPLLILSNVYGVHGPLKLENQGFQITPKLKRGEKVCEEALYAMVF